MMRRGWPRVALLSLSAAALGAGCTHVVTHTAPYYEDGPWQLAPPQGEIPAGTKVLVVGNKGTYSRVWTADFVDAYVWDGALEPWSWWPKAKTEDKAEPARDESEATQPES